MTLRLIREPSRDDCTHSVLFINGHFECFCLEDVIRERPGQPVETWKILGRTAIPEGRYKIALTMSQRFKRVLPLVVDVPGFSGVRIHPGNEAVDTDGCLLPGSGRAAGRVTGSRIAFEHIFEQLQAATDDRWIDIENPRAA